MVTFFKRSLDQLMGLDRSGQVRRRKPNVKIVKTLLFSGVSKVDFANGGFL